MHYTGTIWRPPYEADSLILEATAGCTHRACKFCTLYDELPFKFKASPALEAALDALRPGGVLSAILYSGRVIGSDEKTEILHWMRTLPLTRCTVLVCDFANWAETAPLPCFLLKK